MEGPNNPAEPEDEGRGALLPSEPLLGRLRSVVMPPPVLTVESRGEPRCPYVLQVAWRFGSCPLLLIMLSFFFFILNAVFVYAFVLALGFGFMGGHVVVRMFAVRDFLLGVLTFRFIHLAVVIAL